jgi:hypothetical protein
MPLQLRGFLIMPNVNHKYVAFSRQQSAFRRNYPLTLKAES